MQFNRGDKVKCVCGNGTCNGTTATVIKQFGTDVEVDFGLFRIETISAKNLVLIGTQQQGVNPTSKFRIGDKVEWRLDPNPAVSEEYEIIDINVAGIPIRYSIMQRGGPSFTADEGDLRYPIMNFTVPNYNTHKIHTGPMMMSTRYGNKIVEFSINDKVRHRNEGWTGTVVSTNTDVMGSQEIYVIADEGTHRSEYKSVDFELATDKYKFKSSLKCECGSDSTPGLENQHSNWCPKFQGDRR